MTRVTLDDILRDRLHNLSVPLELCDESGRVVARVYPTSGLSEYEPWVPPMTDREIRELEESDEEQLTTTEVLAHLERL